MPREELVKLYPTGSQVSASVEGESYEVSDDGFMEVEPKHAAVLCEAHGWTRENPKPVKPSKKKKGNKSDDDATGDSDELGADSENDENA